MMLRDKWPPEVDTYWSEKIVVWEWVAGEREPKERDVAKEGSMPGKTKRAWPRW